MEVTKSIKFNAAFTRDWPDGSMHPTVRAIANLAIIECLSKFLRENREALAANDVKSVTISVTCNVNPN